MAQPDARLPPHGNPNSSDSHLRKTTLRYGYYTMAEAPFKFVDGHHVCSFLL